MPRFRLSGLSRGVMTVIAILILASLWFASSEAKGDELFLNAPLHASTAGAASRNVGRNFVQIGWRTDSGFSVAIGPYFAGSSYCSGSLTIAQLIGKNWEGSVTTQGDTGGDSCIGEDYAVAANTGACITRIFSKHHWSTGFGGCIWEHGDYVVGDPPFDNHLVEIGGARFTASVLLRYNFGKK